MSLITFRDVSLAYGNAPLLDQASFSIEPGERICVIGRNGEGKSTLLKLLDGSVLPDNGRISRQQGLRLTRLTQEVPVDLHGSVFDVIAGGLGDGAQLLSEWHTLSERCAHGGDDQDLAALLRIQEQLEHTGAWSLTHRVSELLSRMELDGDAEFADLSGGRKRRALLARALVAAPDVLLLDEPTNHLDVPSIEWLERFLRDWNGTLVFITHDRAFLRVLASRIVELDRGQLSDFPCTYDQYLERKQALLDAEAKQNALFDKRLAQEEVWIRQGIKARRTRNEGRVRALIAMRREHAARRERQGKVTLAVSEAERSGQLVLEASHLGYDWNGKTLIRDFSAAVMRGDKIGLIGVNGVGKTTLLRLLLGDLTPSHGQVRQGTRLEIAYFDQLRAQLNEDATVYDNVAQGSDFVERNGQRQHVISYLGDFLFAPARVRTPVKALSGGERNRLLLAKLFTRPANVLVLDEPTNDLDVETLELLEELLVDFAGTVLLISHDRAFLDNVVTDTWVFEGDGVIHTYVGGYEDWLRQRPAPATSTKTAAKPEGAAAPAKPADGSSKKRKLSFNEQRELAAVPERIAALEAEQASLQTRLDDPQFFVRAPQEATAAANRLAEIEEELLTVLERWEALEAVARGD